MMLQNQVKRWAVAERIPADANEALLEYPEIIRQVLYNRGVSTAEQARDYLFTETGGADPFLLMGMNAAVERILWAVDHHEPLAVYGDYDVDGVTATTLLVEVLRCIGADVRWHIPNRFDEGYGLNNEGLDVLAAAGVELVITVDCGIRSPREADHARELGVDLIISDHHHPGTELPLAAAVICQKQASDPYPDKNLSGVGLAYKITQALLAARPVDGCAAENWLDLVALGTISDIVPLVGENRYLVRRGLQKLRAQSRQGVASLAGAAGVRLESLSAGDVGFMLGPRLNAAGRLESAEAAVRLLLSQDPMESGQLAQQLDSQNRERQVLTREVQETATRLARESGAEDILFAFSPDFNPGVVGLAAARLVDVFYRPAVVGHIDEEFARASCRSIPEFHITQALDECRDLLVRHGGHSAAAGFTVRSRDLPALMARMSDVAHRELGGRSLAPVVKADRELKLGELHPRLFEYLDLLQPTGQENPEAVFVSRGVRVVRSRTVGSDGTHLKMAVSDGWLTYDAIAFRQGQWAGNLPELVDLLYTFERNEYNGKVGLQLNVKDIKKSE